MANLVTNQIKPAIWLTSKRLRAHGIIVALCLWGLYGWNLTTPGMRDRNGNLKGTDFLHLYTLGSIANQHRGADLYDMNAQAALAAERVPEARGIRYLPLYPPQVSIFFAPLAGLSYLWALVWWWGSSAIVYGLCCFSIWRSCPHLYDCGATVVILAVAFPAFFHLIAWGQTSALALACFTLMFFLLRHRRDFLAGLVLGCLIFKPQLGLAAAVVFVSTGAWKTALGALASTAAQISIGILFYGIEPFAPMDAHAVECAHDAAAARAQALSNALSSHILVDAPALACHFPWTLHPECSGRSRMDDRLLEATILSFISAVFGPAVRQCSRGASSYGLRLSDFGSRVSLAGRLARSSADRSIDAMVGHAALPDIHASARRSLRPMDACPVFCGCDGRCVVRDLADLS